MSQIITNKQTCLECGNGFETTPVWVLGEPVFPKRCNECVEELREKEGHRIEIMRKTDFNKKWELTCPPEFRTKEEGGSTDMKILDAAGPGVKEIMEWEPTNKSGLAIYSAESGTLKTRSAWRLIRRLMKEKKWKLVATSGPEFEQDLRTKAKIGMESDWIQDCKNAQIFFVDDIDKACWSRWGKSTFFSILKSRCEYDKTTIITTNQKGTEWQQSFVQDEFGGPIVRRINNHFHVVKL